MYGKISGTFVVASSIIDTVLLRGQALLHTRSSRVSWPSYVHLFCI